jgi:hypothetical protein
MLTRLIERNGAFELETPALHHNGKRLLHVHVACTTSINTHTHKSSACASSKTPATSNDLIRPLHMHHKPHAWHQVRAHPHLSSPTPHSQLGPHLPRRQERLERTPGAD